MNKDTVGYSIKVNVGSATKIVKDVKLITGTKKVLEETLADNGCGVNKDEEKSLSQKIKTPLGQQRSVLDGHVPRDLEVRTGYYSKYPTVVKYPYLAE